MEALFESPHESVHINELARRAGVDPGNTKRYLTKFAEQKLVSLSRQGRTIMASPDLKNTETRKIFELFELNRTRHYLEENKTGSRLLASMAGMLSDRLPDVRMIALYGPCTQILTTTLPVNLAIIVSSGYDVDNVRELAADILRQYSLPYDVKICVHLTEELTVNWKTGECCSDEMWNTRIILYGENFFWHLVATNGLPARAEVEEELAKNA